MRSFFALAAVVCVACGGRLDAPQSTSSDAAIDDSVPCGDAGACAASSQYCSEESHGPGQVAFACTPLPSKCHACECASAPKIGFLCSCIADGARITVSCTAQ